MNKNKSKISLAIVDDHKLFRDAVINSVFKTRKEFLVEIEADNGEDLIKKIGSGKKFDLLIVDINMPIMNGYETVEWIKTNFPEIKILVLTMHDSEDSVSRMFKLGVNGYLTKNVTSDELIIAVTSIMEKGFYYSESVTNKIVNLLRNDNKPKKEKKDSELFLSIWKSLSQREKEFVKFLCTDLTYAQIATKMYLSTKTIEGYRISIFNKFSAKTRVGLAVKVTTHLLSLLKSE